MTHPSEPIATTYVEIRPAPGSKEQLQKDVVAAATPAGKAAGDALGHGLGDGAKQGRRTAEEQLQQLDARMLKTQAAAETLGKGIGHAVVRATQVGGLVVGTAAAAGLSHLRAYDAAVAQLRGNAGLTEKAMERLARSVQGYSGQTDDSVIRAESMLLTFDKIRDSLGAGNDAFTRATKASADMAARFGGEAAPQARILGRALQDPVHGLSALVTAGITFDAQQVRTITQLQKSGQQLEAQKLILDQVEKSVGGSAKAYGQTLPGALDRARAAFDDEAASVLRFAGEHKTLSTVAVGTAGALYLALKAARAYQTILDLRTASAAKRIATNLAEAKSIDAVAAAEARAAAGAGAGGAAAAAGRGGLIGAAGAVGGAVGLAGGIVGLGGILTLGAGIHSIGTVKTNQAVEELHRQLEKAGADQRDLAQYELSLRDKLLGFDKNRLQQGRDLLARLLEQQNYSVDTNAIADRTTLALRSNLAKAQQAYSAAAAARRDPKTLDTSAGVFGGAFDKLPSRIAGDPGPAREALTAANQRVRDAEDALARAGGRTAGASRAQLASAEAGVLSARDAVRKRGGNSQAEELRLQAAESRLSDLRSKGGANTDKIRTAEERLTAARKAAKKAAEDVHKAEAPVALGAEDVLKRLTGQRTNADTLVKDADLLISKGVTGSTLTALQAVEKEAPGSFDKLAKTMTPALAKSLNAQEGALTKAHFEFYDAPRVAALRQAEAAINADKDGLYARLAKANADAYQRALTSGAFTRDDPGGYGAPVGPLDPHEHGAPGPRPTAAPAPAAVHVTLTGVKGETVHRIASSAVQQADRVSGALIGTL